jgi:hypothetical protein
MILAQFLILNAQPYLVGIRKKRNHFGADPFDLFLPVLMLFWLVIEQN